MLPSEKAERWVRRIGYAALILVVLYILLWITKFISSTYGRAMDQRRPPPEAKAPAAELA